MSIIMLIEMIFLHCIADYFLQGILASMKQKSWWEKHAPSRSEFSRSKYKFDYKATLLAHSIEWAFLIMIPSFITMWIHVYEPAYCLPYIIFFDLNVVFHYLIDDMKANKRKINLIEDQVLHFIQLFITWLIWTGIIGWN